MSFDSLVRRKLEKKLKQIDRVIARKPCVLLTLTVDAERHRCPVEALKKAKRAFTKLINWLRIYRKRRYPPDFDYIAVVEVKSKDEKGSKIHIHLHVLLIGIVWMQAPILCLYCHEFLPNLCLRWNSMVR